MSHYKIAVVIGSLRKDSFNRKLALALAHLAPADFTFEHVEISDLPLYNEDIDGDQAPASYTAFREGLKAADAVLFITPEYNRSFPGVLKNAIDHASRPYGQNSWAGKPAGVIGVSVGVIGTALAQQHLRSVLAILDVPTLGAPEVYLQWQEGLIDADGNIGPNSRAFLQGWMDRFVAWVRLHNA